MENIDQEYEVISSFKISKFIGKAVWIDLSVKYTKNNLPLREKDVVTPNKMKEQKYLKKIADKTTQTQDISIDILM